MPATPEEATRAFVHAVVWGEHHLVWEMLGSEAQRTVMEIATSRGMPEPLAARIRGGSATPAELDQFRGDLVNGFRADLLSVDIDTLGYDVLDPSLFEAGSARVVLVVPVPDPRLGAGLPAASVELRLDGDDWRIERLIPRLAK